MSASPLLLLDVDGVLSPYGSHPRTWEDWAQPADVRMQLPLSCRMGDALWQTGCRIEWLTTWGEDANKVIAPHLGWPSLPVWRRLDVPGGVKLSDDGPLGWWKWRWAELRARDSRPLVWADDELDKRREEDPRLDDWLGSLVQPVLLVCCDPHTGLTPDQVSEIGEFAIRYANI